MVRALAIAIVMIGLGVLPGGAQTTSSTEAPSTESTTTTAQPSTESTTASTVDAQVERERVEAAEAAKAAEINATNANLDDLSSALSVLQDRVDAQSARLAYAKEQLAAAERTVAAAQAEVEAATAELGDLETRVGESAIRAFIGDESDKSVLFAVGDPTKAMRMDVMRAQATQTDLDLVEVLRVAEEDLAVRRAEAVDAVEAADRSRTLSEQQLAALEQDQTTQATLVAGAEDRLDHLLAERAALASLGAELDAGLPAADDLANQLASTASPPPSASTVVPPTVVTEDDIAYAGNGINVHVSIVDDIRRLLADAAAAGVDLAGGGYRSSAGQIAARRNNCGTSNYAIYEMPASQCRPPTARPGRSMHERGMAIDFTYNGNLIRSRSGAGWNWLNANAANYGLQNLPSEPWHWSTNGR